MYRRIEIIQIAQKKPARVPDLAVGVNEMIENLLRDAEVFPIVLGGHPEPQDLGTGLFDHLLWRDHITG